MFYSLINFQSNQSINFTNFLHLTLKSSVERILFPRMSIVQCLYVILMTNNPLKETNCA